MRNRVYILQGVATQVLQFELKSTKAPDAIDRGWFECNHDRSGDAKEFRRDARHNITCTMTLAFTVVDRFKRSKHQAIVGRTASGKRKAGNREGAEDVGIGSQNLLG